MVVQRPDQVKNILLKPEKHFGNVLKIFTLIELPDSIIICLNLTVFLTINHTKIQVICKEKWRAFWKGSHWKDSNIKKLPFRMESCREILITKTWFLP